MERLNTLDDQNYSAVEASIHVGRYSVALPFARGRRVLDIACGEGYGTWLLRQAGAEQAVGVDVSREAITVARQAYSGTDLEFHACDAVEAAERLPAGSFDLIVSIETIEHVPDAAAFLEALKRLAAPGAIFIITCPNDHWYYSENESNPFHLRKYYFEEFRDLTVASLGQNVQWFMGTPALGFSSVPLDSSQIPMRPRAWSMCRPPISLKSSPPMARIRFR